MPEEHNIEEVIESAASEVVVKAKETAAKSPIIKYLVLAAAVVSMGGFATIKTWKNEITGLICENSVRLAEAEKDIGNANTVTLQSLHMNAYSSTLVCYQIITSEKPKRDDTLCQAIMKEKQAEAQSYLESLQDK